MEPAPETAVCDNQAAAMGFLKAEQIKLTISHG